MQRVQDIMSRRVVAIGDMDRLSTVKDIMMLGDVRHMPVVSAGYLVGVVSETDLCVASLSVPEDLRRRPRLSEDLDNLSIRQIMSAPAIVVGEMASIREAADMMAREQIGCLPVVNEAGGLEGLVTETDVLRFFVGVH